VFVHPADALLGEGLRRLDADVLAGERLAVEAQDLADLRQFDPGGEIFEDVLAAGGLELEVGFAPFVAGLEDSHARVVPGLEFIDANALKDGRDRRDEVH